MSTEQTDSYNNFQQSVYQNFVAQVDEYREGMVDYDAIEEELESMVIDDDISKHTYSLCKKYWDNAKDEEDFWQEEERRKWDEFYQGSGVNEVY